MRLTTRILRPLILTGFTVAVLTVGVPAAPATDTNGHVDQLGARGVPERVEAASLNRASGPLPGSDTPIPAVAAGLLVGSAGLAWVVRRSSPSRAV